MSIQTNWHVVTGTLHSGKTPLINYLSFLGYKTSPEVARLLIDLERSRGKSTEEIRKDESEFQSRVNIMKLNLESTLDLYQTIFFDRGVPDDIAYSRLRNMETSPLFKIVRDRVYKKVFVLDSLPFEADYARTEDSLTALKIDKLIREAYLDSGYSFISVPVMPLDLRADFILENCQF